MADVAGLVRQLVQDTDGPAPVKSLTELKYPQFEYALPGFTDGSVKTAAEGHLHLPVDTEEDEGTQRMSAANVLALRQLPGGPQETVVPSWEEAQTMVASAALMDGPTITSIGRDVDWSAPDPEPTRKGNVVMWATVGLGALLALVGLIVLVVLNSSQTGSILQTGTKGRFESKSLAGPTQKVTGEPTDPAVIHATGLRAIEISSDPPGAAIFVNDTPQSKVTPATLHIPATKGAIRIKLTKSGYSDHESEFPDGAPSLVVLLTPLDAQPPAPVAAPENAPTPTPPETLQEAPPTAPKKTVRRRRRR